MLDDFRPLAEQSAVFRRNASLIDLNAAAAAGRELFAALPYRGASAQSASGHGSPPFLRAIFDAAVAARTVAPARPEIELLHGWSAFHLDPETTVAHSTSRRDARYRIDVDEMALLEVFDRAATLAPDDPLYAEALRVVGETSAALIRRCGRVIRVR